MSYITCYDANYKLIGEYKAPFDMEIDCHVVRVYGNKLSGMKLVGKCNLLVFIWVRDYKIDDLSGFIDLEINKIHFSSSYKGLLKLLELNCENIDCSDDRLSEIMNKYLKEEDPLMRDFEGFKLEMAVSGYRNRI